VCSGRDALQREEGGRWHRGRKCRGCVDMGVSVSKAGAGQQPCCAQTPERQSAVGKVNKAWVMCTACISAACWQTHLGLLQRVLGHNLAAGCVHNEQLGIPGGTQQQQQQQQQVRQLLAFYCLGTLCALLAVSWFQLAAVVPAPAPSYCCSAPAMPGAGAPAVPAPGETHCFSCL
jgi:hypothetical protein